MHDDRFLPRSSADPLRHIDARFEPFDPIFDAEEPDFRRPFHRKRTRAGAALAALIASTLGCGDNEPPAVHAAGSILVQLSPDSAPPAPRAPADLDPPIVALSPISEEGGAVLEVPLPAGADPLIAAEEASRQAGVAFAEPVYVYRQSVVPNDPRWRDLWGLQKIGAPAAWARTTGDRRVVVAVIDDGVELDHPDLQPNLWVNPDEIPGNGQDDDGDGIVDDVNGANFVGTPSGDPSPFADGEAPYHGSHVAGTIGAVGDNHLGVLGVNWKVSLMAVRALGPQGGRSGDLAKAIAYAVDHGARVINASWGGGGRSQVLSKAIARAGEHGVLFATAAGNDAGAKPEFPADLRLGNVISVGATTPADALAPFSNRAALLAAPGVGILSTTSAGHYERMDGTSMATPHVAGLAALLWAAHPEATISELRKAMADSAVAVPGVQAGRIDAAKALEILDGGGASERRLELSRSSLSFSVRGSRIPRAQVVSVRSKGGGARSFTAKASVSWIELSKSSGTTPSRISIKVNPSRLGAGSHDGEVVFSSDPGDQVALAVSVRAAAGAAVAVHGQDCALREGALHARAGSSCTLSAAEGDSPSIRWRLPGGGQASGARLYAQFLRKGTYEVQVAHSEGQAESLAVVIE